MPAFPLPMSPRRLLVFLALGLLAFLAGLTASRWALEHSPGGSHLEVRLQGGSPFRIRQKNELLGLELIRVKTGKHPQEFLVVTHVPVGLADRLYGKPVNLQWANSIANQYLKVRDADKDRPPRTVEIDRIDTVELGTMRVGRRNLPYWQLLFRFRLGSETGNRFYEAGILRHVRANEKDADTLLFAFSPKGSFEKSLIPALAQSLRFRQVANP